MDLQVRTEPPRLSESAGRVLLLEAEPVQERRDFLEEWVAQVRSQGGKGWFLPCHFDEGGPWAGITDLFLDLLPDLEVSGCDLLVRHDYELASILPSLRAKLSPRNPSLTDVASVTEQVRLYPADRAFRILHGLIDLIAAWKTVAEPSPWLLVCNDFDQAGFLARRFFQELARRRGRSHGLTLVLVCSPGRGSNLLEAFAPEIRGDIIKPQFATLASPKDSANTDLTRAAQELEDRVGTDPLVYESFLPQLIRNWSRSRTPERAAPWQYEAFLIYTSRGFYLDSIAYGEGALSHLENFFPDDEAKRWRIINKLFACHCATGSPQRALEIVEDTLSRLRSPKFRALAHYVLAMLHARYLPTKDFAKAEEQLEIGLAELYLSDLPVEELHFQVAFNRNGLAFIRHRQGLAMEAIRLCREGFESLRAHLREDRHCLHKSVLLYNIAQVYTSVGEYEEAIKHYTAAMEMDPNYSEYYNERGNLHLKNGLLDKALSDYLCAVELSPPFPEVYANLGHCYYRMNKIGDALASYAVSLDLDPYQPELRVMRAQCFEAMGDLDQALGEYTESLKLRPNQPLVLANRACLQYQAGRPTEALQDLDRAVELAPEVPDLYQNRAVALKDLGRNKEAAQDLETYLQLRPEADDLTEVLQRIANLRDQNSHHSATQAAL
jgi:tetratricopeptide (TPR) repeat protein